jgi:hypothetical protein
MGTKNDPGKFDCYAALDPNEPHFVLRSTDKLAPGLVRVWTALRENNPIGALDEFTTLVKTAEWYENPNRDKLGEALNCAAAMEDWRESPKCTNHPERVSRTNLDGDELCQECADAWVRGEGQSAADDDRP